MTHTLSVYTSTEANLLQCKQVWGIPVRDTPDPNGEGMWSYSSYGIKTASITWITPFD
jgi:hypothetical protein